MICADAICVYLLMMKCALQFALENPVVILVLTIIISFTVTSSDVISPLDVTYQCIRNISYIFEKKKLPSSIHHNLAQIPYLLKNTF